METDGGVLGVLGSRVNGMFWADSRANYLGGFVVDHLEWREFYLLLESLDVGCDVSTGSRDVVMRGLRVAGYDLGG